MYELCEKVEKHLRDNGIQADFVDYDEKAGTILVDILWGDWKHEHLRADYLVAQLGGTHVYTYDLESDGSDCYSGRHEYKFARRA
jgi:hypothetical protein